MKAFVDFDADVASHGDAVFEGDAVDGDEGDDVGCSHARGRAQLLSEIDELGGLAYSANRGFLNGTALADQCDDAAVMVGIHLTVEKIDTGNFHGVDDGIDFGLVAAFGKIGNAFDERAGHGVKNNGQRLPEATRDDL